MDKKYLHQQLTDLLRHPPMAPKVNAIKEFGPVKGWAALRLCFRYRDGEYDLNQAAYGVYLLYLTKNADKEAEYLFENIDVKIDTDVKDIVLADKQAAARLIYTDVIDFLRNALYDAFFLLQINVPAPFNPKDTIGEKQEVKCLRGFKAFDSLNQRAKSMVYRQYQDYCRENNIPPELMIQPDL